MSHWHWHTDENARSIFWIQPSRRRLVDSRRDSDFEKGTPYTRCPSAASTYPEGTSSTPQSSPDQGRSLPSDCRYALCKATPQCVVPDFSERLVTGSSTLLVNFESYPAPLDFSDHPSLPYPCTPETPAANSSASPEPHDAGFTVVYRTSRFSAS
ncbi:hypothetical protein BKA93DRAFT_753423 [Sparassis latifolia]